MSEIYNLIPIIEDIKGGTDWSKYAIQTVNIYQTSLSILRNTKTVDLISLTGEKSFVTNIQITFVGNYNPFIGYEIETDGIIKDLHSVASEYVYRSLKVGGTKHSSNDSVNDSNISLLDLSILIPFSSSFKLRMKNVNSLNDDTISFVINITYLIPQ